MSSYKFYISVKAAPIYEMDNTNWPKVVGFTLFPSLGGIAAGFVKRPNLDKWYNELKKPEWRPPNWAFGPVWFSLYTGMGYASYLVFREGGGFQGNYFMCCVIFQCLLD